MSRRRSKSALGVYAQNERMGTLERRPGGEVEFRYASTWLARDDAYPMSLSLPLFEGPHVKPVMTVLDNLLPDALEVRRAIAARIGSSGADPYSLLWELGRDCVGALQFVPQGEQPPAQGEPYGDYLTDEGVEEILLSLGATPLGVGRHAAQFRISVAGAQEKTALLKIDGVWYLPSGTTPSSHIIKPSIGMRGQIDLSSSVENEHMCMTLLRELGLNAAHTEVRQFGRTTALVVRRFDRNWHDGELVRLPQEDICQALGIPSYMKYEADGGPGILDVLRLLESSDDPTEDQKAFLQAHYAFWLLGATDGHAKNFSLALGPQYSFRLTPLYDVMSLQPLVDAHQVNRRDYRMAMSVGSNRHYKMDEILPRHFVQSARQAGIHEDTAQVWLHETNERLPQALERVSNEIIGSPDDTLFASVSKAASRRANIGL